MPHFACPTIRGMWNWMTVSDCKCMANLSSAWFSLLPGDPTTTPWNLLDTWKPFALGKTVSDPQEATYPVPGSSISSNSYLSDPLRRHVRSSQWIHMIPLNLHKVSWIEVPECRVSPGWERFFRTARGSNNKSMEPSRHLKTFCLGENCFRPSWSDLSSARLINQVQTF